MVRLQLATERSLVSAFIRWYTWSDWSHVDFVLPDGNLLGARLKGGVQVRKPGYAPFSRTLVLECPDAPERVYDFALSQVGKPYDWWAIVGMGLRHDWRDPARWFCSELVAWCFEMARYPLLRAKSVDRITPQGIWRSPRPRIASPYPVL